jgi:hypothetical protein
MEGSITERQDPEGRIRRKGEMKLPHRKYPSKRKATCSNSVWRYRCKTYIAAIQVGDLPTSNIANKRCISY